MIKTNSTNNRIKNIYTVIMAVILTVSVLAMTSMSASAAPVVPEQYNCIFNAEYYAARYQDLAAVFGNNAAALFNHFLTAGMAEGRQGSAEFDVNFYRAAYPDLAAVFGDNLSAYYNHYMTCGKAEGRVGAGAATAAQTDTTTTTPAQTAQAGNGGVRVYQNPGYRRASEFKFYTDILDSILTPGMSDMEVARAIHDYLCRTYHYAQAGEPVVRLSDIYMERIGKIEDGYGNRVNQERANSTAFYCGGYAQAYRTLMNIAGIQTECLAGIAVNSAGKSDGHEWNRSLINGQWLYTDVCWDDSLGSTKYFMISESQMAQNHFQDRNFH